MKFNDQIIIERVVGTAKDTSALFRPYSSLEKVKGKVR